MLSSGEHEILNAHKYKISRMQHLSGSYKPRILFFLLINVKILTIVGILTFMNRRKSCMKKIINSGTLSIRLMLMGSEVMG